MYYTNDVIDKWGSLTLAESNLHHLMSIRNWFWFLNDLLFLFWEASRNFRSDATVLKYFIETRYLDLSGNYTNPIVHYIFFYISKYLGHYILGGSSNKYIMCIMNYASLLKKLSCRRKCLWHTELANSWTIEHPFWNHNPLILFTNSLKFELYMEKGKCDLSLGNKGILNIQCLSTTTIKSQTWCIPVT